MPRCCSIPPCPRKVSEGLQQVAKSYSLPISSSTSQPPAHVHPREPEHIPKVSDSHLMCKLLEMTQWQRLSKQQQMLKQKLQQQIPREGPSARTWSVLGFLPEYTTHKRVAEQGQASGNISSDFTDACITRYFRYCNYLASLLLMEEKNKQTTEYWHCLEYTCESEIVGFNKKKDISVYTNK